MAEATKKKKSRKWIRNGIIAAAVVAVLGFFGSQAQRSGAVLPTVETARVEKGDIDQVVSISGTVITDEAKTFFIDLATEVDAVNVERGDVVKEGDVLITYNQEKLDNAVRQAKLNKQQAAGTYSDMTYYNQKVFDQYGLSSFKTIDEQIDHIDTWIDQIQQQITAKQNRFNDTLHEFEIYTQDYDENGQAGIQEYTDDILEKQLIMQRAMSGVQHALQNDEEIRSWTRQIEELNQLKADLSQARMTDGAKSAASANKQLADLAANETIDSVEKIREGIAAPFDGVITALSAVEGMMTAPGTSLLTIESTEKIKVLVNVTKYDMEKVKEGQDVTVTIAGQEYNGRVSKIAKTATKNERGGSIVPTEIEILNPDENIILGIDADADIQTASKKDVILIPIEAINVDSKGSFAYVLENDTVVRRDIETGVASDMYEEVLSGLSEGDKVLTSITSEITEGMQAQSAVTEEEETE